MTAGLGLYQCLWSDLNLTAMDFYSISAVSCHGRWSSVRLLRFGFSEIAVCIKGIFFLVSGDLQTIFAKQNLQISKPFLQNNNIYYFFFVQLT